MRQILAEDMMRIVVLSLDLHLIDDDKRHFIYKELKEIFGFSNLFKNPDLASATMIAEIKMRTSLNSIQSDIDSLLNNIVPEGQYNYMVCFSNGDPVIVKD